MTVSAISLSGWQQINLGSTATTHISSLYVHPNNAAKLLVSYLRTFLVIASHQQTLYVILYVTHFSDMSLLLLSYSWLSHIRRYISLSVAKTIVTALITFILFTFSAVRTSVLFQYLWRPVLVLSNFVCILSMLLSDFFTRLKQVQVPPFKRRTKYQYLNYCY